MRPIALLLLLNMLMPMALAQDPANTPSDQTAWEQLKSRLDVRQRQHLLMWTGTEDGIEAIDAFIDRYPESEHQGEALYLRAIGLWNMYRYAEAAPAYEAYLEACPDQRLSSLAMTRLAQSYLRSDQPMEAVVTIERYEDAPAAKQRELHLADAHLLLGNVDKARAIVQTWIDLADQSPRGRQVLRAAQQQLDRINLIGEPLKQFKKPEHGSDRILEPERFKGKVLLVDFWASWCKPCMAQMPELVQLHEKYHEHGLEILGISLDSDATRMEAALEKVGAKWPQFYDGRKWDNTLAKLFEVSRIPMVLLVDGDGTIVQVDPPAASLERLVRSMLDTDEESVEIINPKDA